MCQVLRERSRGWTRLPKNLRKSRRTCVSLRVAQFDAFWLHSFFWCIVFFLCGGWRGCRVFLPLLSKVRSAPSPNLPFRPPLPGGGLACCKEKGRIEPSRKGSSSCSAAGGLGRSRGGPILRVVHRLLSRHRVQAFARLHAFLHVG